MLKGIHLTLMIGPVVPVPVPEAVLNALQSVQVSIGGDSKTPSGFELTFALGNRSPLQTLFLLIGGSLPPILRVILVVTVNGLPEVLIDGVVTQQQIQPGPDPAHSVLTLTGVDLTAVMGLIDLDGVPYPAMPPEARVALMLAKYAWLGIVPLIIPSLLSDVPIPTQEIPRQQSHDLDYINDLADKAGYVFYLNPGPLPGMNVAYWGPEIRVGVPQPALNLDMDAFRNVEHLTFSFDADHKAMPIVFIQNPETKVPIPIPIPDISPLSPPLGLLPPIPKQFPQLRDTAKLSPIKAILTGMVVAARTSDAVTGTGSLDVLRYGRLLKARQLVGVRGAGTAYDGLYYVKSVTHSIKVGEYKQSFSLVRNGLVSTLSQVPA